jgi:hypothetical protein
MSELDPLEELADRYRNEGYEVVVRPRPEELPPFFANSDVLLLAVKGGEYRAVHPPPQPAGTAPDHGRPPVTSGREPDAMHLRTLLAEAERCLRAGAIEAALLLSWSVLEAALREAVRQPGTAFIRPPMPRDLLREAARSRILSPEELSTVEQVWHLRTMVAHGLRPDLLPADPVTELISIARRLIAAPPSESAPEQGAALNSVSYGYGIRQVGELLPLASQANRVLSDVIGPTAGQVSAEWDRTEDTRGRTIVTLRLSDPTGAVTGTFTPDDLRAYPILRNRLFRLWGDLLQVRNHQQLQGLGASSGREGD